MASDNDDKNSSTPLDAERAKLKAAGYTDAEVSQILVSKALSGSPQGSSAAPQGVMSNALSSIVAIAGHARILVPSFRQDFANIFDRNVATPTRSGSALALTLKAAVIAILAYAGWMEWQQHIISATEIAQSEARKRHAEECSARMKAYVDNTPMDRLLEGNEELSRDCDPTYATRVKECDAQFQALLDEVEHLTGPAADAEKNILAKVEKHKSECNITAAQRQLAAAKVAELKKKAAVASKSTPEEAKVKKEKVDIILKGIAKLSQFSELENKILSASIDGDDDRAYDLAQGFVFYYSALKSITDYDKANDFPNALKSSELLKTVVETPGIVNKDKQAEEKAVALISIAWYSLMTRDFAKALDASQQAIALRPDDLVAKTNQAHALLLLGRVEEAKAIYLANKGKPLQKKTWEAVIQEDFEKLRKQGISNAAMIDIAAMLQTSPAPMPKPSPPPVAAKPIPPPPQTTVRTIDPKSFTSPPTASRYNARDVEVIVDKLDFMHCDSANCATVRTLPACTRLRVQFLDDDYRKPINGLMGVSLHVAGYANGGWDYGVVEASGVEWTQTVERCLPRNLNRR